MLNKIHFNSIMNFLQFLKKQGETNPLHSILILTAILLCSLVLAQIVGGGIMLLMADIKLSELPKMLDIMLKSEKGWWAMMVGQGVSSAFTFIVPGLLFWYAVEKKTFSDFSFKPFPIIYTFGLITLIHLSFSPFSGYLQSLNEEMKLPEALKSLEEFMKGMEENGKVLTEYLTTFNSTAQFIIALIVIAIIAGIGEELIFRGLLQRKLLLLTQNPHVAIWLAAAIFSAIHFQFYGFLPRLALGALFGYLYYWSGNIWVPIFGHILNNGLAVIIMHLVHLKKVSPEIEKLDTVPMPYLILSTILCMGLLYFFKKQTEQVQDL